MTPTRTQIKTRRTLQFERERGFLMEVNGTTRADDGRIWVSVEKSTGNLAPPVRLLPSVGAPLPNKGNIPVEVGYDRTGQMRVLGIDSETLIQQGIDPSILNPALPKVMRQEQIVNLACRKHPSQPFYAIVYPGLTIINGTVVDFAGNSGLDLSTYQPSAGNHRYVGICLDDDGTIDVSASTSQSTGTPLDSTDLQEVYNGRPAGGRVLWAFVFNGDDADFSDEGSKDMRDVR